MIADATDELLDKLDSKTMLKVLTPHGGKAIVGLAKGGKGTLSKGKLEEWAKGFGVPETKIIEETFGLWAVVTKPQLPGMPSGRIVITVLTTTRFLKIR